jgi:hypothetical protein
MGLPRSAISISSLNLIFGAYEIYGMNPLPSYLNRSFFGLLMIFVMLGRAHGVAKAQDQNLNTLSYRCDVKQDHIILSYDDPLPDDKLGVNSWNMDSLWGPGSDENLRVRRTITQRCNLSSGTFEVKISPDGSEDVQMDCGANPSTAHADIYFKGEFLFGSDFNDSPCDTGDNNFGIDQIRVNGKSGTITLSYGRDLF